MFRSRQVDGILIYPTNHDRLDHIRAVRQAGYPVLVLADIPFAGLDVVAINDRTGGYRARPSLDRARPSPYRDTRRGAAARQQRKARWRAACDRRRPGSPPQALIVIKPGGHSATDGYQAIAGAMQGKERPTALFATTDSLAIGAMRWCREQGHGRA